MTREIGGPDGPSAPGRKEVFFPLPIKREDWVEEKEDFFDDGMGIFVPHFALVRDKGHCVTSLNPLLSFGSKNAQLNVFIENYTILDARALNAS